MLLLLPVASNGAGTFLTWVPWSECFPPIHAEVLTRRDEGMVGGAFGRSLSHENRSLMN